MSSKVPNGLGSAPITPGYIVGIKLGYFSLTDILTTSITISAPGAKTRSVPVAAEATTRSCPLN